MLRLIGAAAITIFTTGAGVLLSRELKSRLRELKCLSGIIKRIETQIRYNASDVRTILKEITSGSAAREFRVLSACSNAATGAQMAAGIEENKFMTSLTAEDMRVVRSFFTSLGKNDVEGELENCRLHEDMLLPQIEDAEQQVRDKTKLYCSLGLFAGLMISIIII